MKNILLVCITLFSLQMLNAQNQESLDRTKNNSNKKWTMEQVKTIASKYNLQNHPLLTEAKNSALLYAEKEEIEVWCQNILKVEKSRAESAEFNKNSQYVRNLEDLFKLIDANTSLREAQISSFGSEAEFNKYRNKLRKYKTWRIYRNVKGGLAIRQGDKPMTKEEGLLGQRIDNLPKF